MEKKIVEILNKAYGIGKNGKRIAFNTKTAEVITHLYSAGEEVSDGIKVSIGNLYDKYKNKGRQQFIDAVGYYISTRFVKRTSLPTEEEIEAEANERSKRFSDFAERMDSFVLGAKWVITLLKEKR